MDINETLNNYNILLEERDEISNILDNEKKIYEERIYEYRNKYRSLNMEIRNYNKDNHFTIPYNDFVYSIEGLEDVRVVPFESLEGHVRPIDIKPYNYSSFKLELIINGEYRIFYFPFTMDTLLNHLAYYYDSKSNKTVITLNKLDTLMLEFTPEDLLKDKMLYDILNDYYGNSRKLSK